MSMCFGIVLACSRAYYDAVDIMGRHLHPHEHFRCAPDGSYDRLQCINKQCLCVDALDGAPTFPEEDLVDLKDIDKKVLSCCKYFARVNFLRI